MDDFGDDQRRQSPGARQVARLVLPVFAVSTLVMLVGIVLVATHHRTVGIVVVAVGAVGGFVVRAWLVMRSQQGPRPHS